MASNYFGNIFRITTWGESHGPAIGVVIDGCPAGIELSVEDIQTALLRRAPGKNFTSPRQEADEAHIYSGVFEGKTTGTPISIVIYNRDADSSKYEPIKDILRPGHAQYTYLQKYGVYDYRGGGRASARETACRVAAGAVAKKILKRHGISVNAFLNHVGSIHLQKIDLNYLTSSKLFCADAWFEEQLQALLVEYQNAGNSVGGNVAFQITGVPVGWGDPVYEKLEANLAKAMLSIPASKAFEIGDGFQSSFASGSEFNDTFNNNGLEITLNSNHAGGTLGGISSGMPIYGCVAFKPTSSIMYSQNSVNLNGEPAVFSLPDGSRHDPCVAIRAVPVVEAMCYLVCLDAMLMNRVIPCE
jgi:chorismate synthase